MKRLFSLLFLFPFFVAAQKVNVTFLVNTATVPDTIRSAAFVQIRGDKSPLTQDSTSPVICMRIAGDYWKATVQFTPQDTIEYKFFVNGGRNKFFGLEGSPSRTLIVGMKDTTLPLQYVFGSVQDTNQYWRPYTETDSIEVLFRVNMQEREDFNPATEKLGLRGGTPPLNWANSIFLERENQHINPTSREYNGGHFWSTVVRFPRTVSDSIIHYLFVRHNSSDLAANNPAQWEDISNSQCEDEGDRSNRTFRYKTSMSDTTLAYKYWSNRYCPKPYPLDTFIVHFRIDLSTAIKNYMYAQGDSILVSSGHSGSANKIKKSLLIKMGQSNQYETTDTIFVLMGAPSRSILYRYVQSKNGNEIFEQYYNFSLFESTSDITVRKLRSLTYQLNNDHKQFISILDTAKSSSESRRQPVWFIGKNIQQNMLLTVTCNLQPAYYQLSTRKDTLFSSLVSAKYFNITQADSVYLYGVSINGVGFDTKGWLPWGDALYNDTSRTMYDDGTHGDKFINDRIYTRQFMLFADSLKTSKNIIEYKFGIRGYDNEAGKYGYMINHFMMTPIDINNFTKEVEFGSQYPTLYSQWCYDCLIESVEKENIAPQYFMLLQNYPNPFNPKTTITFTISGTQSIPVQKHNAQLYIFDLLGRKIATLVDNHLDPGTYKVTWDAKNVPSGLYFYRLQSGIFSETKRMLLVK
ncbi:MAG: T9SS type A sorting domain-containing protein [Bacteroidota bacterium]